MNVPKLRFRDDDGREFPSWHAKKIGDFVTSHKGGAPLKPSDFIKEGSFEVIPKKAISSGGHLNLDKAEPTYCTADFFEKNQRSIVDKNYLITTLRDLVPSGPSIGYIVKFNNDKKYILAQGVYGFKINDVLLDEFLIQYSNTDNYRVLMQTMMVGSTQVHIRNSDFFKTPFCVPCLDEQTKIANFLTTVDEKITQLTQKSDLLAQYKKGVMQKIFSQALRFKDDDGREFPEWKQMTLGNIFNERSERGFAEAELLSVTMNKGVKRRSDIDAKDNSSSDKSNYKRVLKNDIVYNSMRMWQGASGVTSFDGIVSPAYTVLESNNNNNSIYFAYLFKTKKMMQIFQRCSQGLTSDTWNLKYPELSKIAVSCPSKSEQTKIANFLTTIDDKISQTQSELDAVKQYKQGLLQQMFV
jgi:type I restriction enzyme S subunit